MQCNKNIKKYLSLLSCFCAFVSLHASEIKDVESKIEHVIVYRQGAQIERAFTVSLPAGRTDVYITGLSPKIVERSIQVAAGNNITIMSVNFTTDFLNPQIVGNEVKQLDAQRKQINDSINLITRLNQVYQQEKDMIIANRSIAGNSGVSANELRATADFFRERLSDIEILILNNTLKVERMRIRTNTLTQQLQALNVQMNKPSGVVKLTVSAQQPVRNANMQFTYIINDALWVPNYDIRILDVDAPLSLFYKAQVFQNTDEDWSNVRLTLSTGNPSLNNTKPELQPYFLNFPPPPPVVRGAGTAARAPSMELVADDVQMMDFEEAVAIEEVVVVAFGAQRRQAVAAPQIPLAVQQQQVSVEFKIDIPYTIPSDNKPYDVTMIEYQIPVTYQYSSVPKLSPDVFLIAQIPDWNEYNLQNGEANLFFQGVFQGKTNIDVHTTADTLSISIGRDKDIIVERKLKTDYQSRRVVGSNVREQRSWEIIVRNNKNIPVRIIIEDQYPVSRNSDIRIEDIQHAGAKANTDNGQLVWDLQIPPRATEQLNFSYTVRYPANRRLIVN